MPVPFCVGVYLWAWSSSSTISIGTKTRLEQGGVELASVEKRFVENFSKMRKKFEEPKRRTIEVNDMRDEKDITSKWIFYIELIEDV